MEIKNFEELEEVHIFCNHKLDINSIELVAEQLASKLKLNIEYNCVQDGKTLQNTIVGESTSEIVTNLFCNDAEKSEYVFELGNAALLISKEIIIYELPTNELFKTLNKIHTKEKNSLHTTEYFKCIFEELAALGVEEVVFAEDNETIRSLKASELTFNEYTAIVKQSGNYFTVPTQISIENN